MSLSDSNRKRRSYQRDMEDDDTFSVEFTSIACSRGLEDKDDESDESDESEQERIGDDHTVKEGAIEVDVGKDDVWIKTKMMTTRHAHPRSLHQDLLEGSRTKATELARATKRGRRSR
jgi:hypothetical protein